MNHSIQSDAGQRAPDTIYTLDLSKWRCGDNSPNDDCRLGDGETKMLNKHGFMCCLGQFAEQRGYGEACLGNGEPSDIASLHLEVYDERFVFIDDEDGGSNAGNTALANECIEINDAVATDIWQKLCALAERLDREGLRLIVTGDLPATGGAA